MKKIASGILCIGALLLSAASEEANGPGHECTSWMIFSDLTGNNTNILHKNRDALSRDIVVVAGGNSSRRWIGLGNRRELPGCPCMGMNNSGLAAVVNGGELTPENSADQNWNGRTTPQLLKDILDNCDTAAQAVERLRGFIAAKDYSHQKEGSIFLFTDVNEGYIVELTAGFVSAQRVDRGYALRANTWHNPGMAQRSCNIWLEFSGSFVREHAVISNFHKAIYQNGRLGLVDSLAMSRNCEDPKEAQIERRVCYTYTNSGSTLVIDREYPDVLSVGYVTIGHPRHTICVPIPICAEKLDERMEETVWSKAAWVRFEKLGLRAPIPKEWLDFEEKSRVEYDACLAEARKLLRAGRKTEAIALLNAAAAKIWQGAAELLEL